MLRFIPVSYTHLDVYKRQDYDRVNNVLVVLKTEKEDAHPGVKLVWLQP